MKIKYNRTSTINQNGERFKLDKEQYDLILFDQGVIATSKEDFNKIFLPNARGLLAEHHTYLGEISNKANWCLSIIVWCFLKSSM